MADYRRLISYIYSYEKGVKAKNSGFAKIESRNGVCKLNISLRISDILINEAEENALEVFLFYRNNEKVEKINIGQIGITGGCSEFRTQMKSEQIGSQGIALSKITGIFICSRAFLHKNSRISIIYASEWDDIPINVDEFTDEDNFGNNKELQDNEEMDYNKEESTVYEESEIRASEVTKAEEIYESPSEVLPQEIQFQNTEQGMNETDNERCMEKETNPIESDGANNHTEESHSDGQPVMGMETEERDSGNEDAGIQENEIDKMPDCEACKRQLKEILSEERNDSLESKTPDTADYFKMLCNCYPKIKINEIDGECIKITPHDISYLPKKYWHLCNNSFLLHGFYNYKYLILCEKRINDVQKHMICVPGMFHNKEQTMARMFGFTEFEGGQQNGRMKFGYWCMYL